MAKLWLVGITRPPALPKRKIRVWPFIVLAETEAEAKDKAIDAFGGLRFFKEHFDKIDCHPLKGDVWSLGSREVPQ